MRPVLLAALAVAMTGGLPRAGRAALTPEPLSAWRYFKEIQAARVSAELLDFVLDKETLNGAREDQADLRLFDNAGREIPYVLRVRRDGAVNIAFPAREFDRGLAGGSAQLSLDLGDTPQEHNQVDVETGGNNFHRIVQVEGGPDGVQWFTLASGSNIFRFVTAGRTVSQQTVDYPISRYRYLRIRVARDPQTDPAAPQLIGVRVQRSVPMKGETVSFEGNLEGREPDRVNARPASVWRVDLGGRVPIQRVIIMVNEAMTNDAFSRPFRLEAIDDPAAPIPLTAGELRRRAPGELTPGKNAAANSPANQLSIEFPEHFARRLKLSVIDDRNAPLPITGVTAQSAARQVVFETAAAGSAPLRLYYGNPAALAPHYDLAARLPAELRPAPARVTLGAQRGNPVYHPEPKPFSERSPWLVYVVLGAASIALAAILISLARAATRGAAPG